MNRFTVEETNLLSIYHEGSKAQLIENMTAALPYMDAGLRELAERTISKVNALTDAEYKELSVAATKPQGKHPCEKGVLQLREWQLYFTGRRGHLRMPAAHFLFAAL